LNIFIFLTNPKPAAVGSRGKTERKCAMSFNPYSLATLVALAMTAAAFGLTFAPKWVQRLVLIIMMVVGAVAILVTGFGLPIFWVIIAVIGLALLVAGYYLKVLIDFIKNKRGAATS
jgi:hypothetical protein